MIIVVTYIVPVSGQWISTASMLDHPGSPYNHAINQSVPMFFSSSIQFQFSFCLWSRSLLLFTASSFFLPSHIVLNAPRASLVCPHGSISQSSWNLLTTQARFVESTVSRPVMKVGHAVAVNNASPGCIFERWVMIWAAKISRSSGNTVLGHRARIMRER